ncbi:MAG: hypothetical protein NT007_18630 [Candidatus Kapabacteria bacterium]|nr:hypothetical protein [Candidatus Kapabacteria bacterium]
MTKILMVLLTIIVVACADNFQPITEKTYDLTTVVGGSLSFNYFSDCRLIYFSSENRYELSSTFKDSLNQDYSILLEFFIKDTIFPKTLNFRPNLDSNQYSIGYFYIGSTVFSSDSGTVTIKNFNGNNLNAIFNFTARKIGDSRAFTFKNGKINY